MTTVTEQDSLARVERYLVARTRPGCSQSIDDAADGAGTRWALLAPDVRDIADRCRRAEERLRLAVGVLVKDGYFTPDEVDVDVAPRIGELASHLRGVIARARQAVSIAGDGTDTTDWQRGYRACSDRAMAVLGQGERMDTTATVPPSVQVKPIAPRVPDLPCPKCGDPDVRVAYCDGCDLRPTPSMLGKYEDDRCSHGDPEHLHRSCRRCSYRWRTDDVKDARTVCAR